MVCILNGVFRPEDMDKPFDPQTMSLLPINIMLEALSMRFKFHFESSKPTNRLDKVIIIAHIYEMHYAKAWSISQNGTCRIRKARLHRMCRYY